MASLAQPYLHYKCNDNGATQVIDNAGSLGATGDGIARPDNLSSWDVNHNGTDPSGKINTAIEGNGTDEHFDCNGFVTNIESNTSGTICFWLYVNSYDGTVFTFGDNDAPDNFLRCYTSTTAIVFDLSSGGTQQWRSQSSGQNTAGWFWVCATHDGTSPTVYINNSEDSTDIVTTDQTQWLNDITFANTTIGRILCGNIGGGGDEHHFDARIDDIRYYQNTVLTSDQRDLIYNNGYGTEEQMWLDATPSAQTMSLTQNAPTLLTTIEAGSFAVGLTLETPSFIVSGEHATQSLTLTLNDPAYMVRMFPDNLFLTMTQQTVTPVPVNQMYDPEVVAGCPQCGTFLYEGKEMFSEAQRFGKHMDDDDDEYVRCARCGFPIRVSRHRAGDGRQGWGMTYTLYDRTTGL